MAKYKAYPEYKDSGVEFLGPVPNEWSVKSLKNIVVIVNGSTPKSGVEEYWDGDINWITPTDLSQKSGVYLNDSQRKITNKGLGSCGTSLVPENTVILSTRAPIGSLAIAGTQSCTNQGCKSLVVRNKESSLFLYYYLSISTSSLNNLGRGSTFLELSTEDLASFKVPMPNVGIGTIVSFLDHETAKIDKLIEKQQQLIELLKEKRQAVISHAVTKGLNPDVQMKDSGVEWLGEVPEHWRVMPLKYICALIKDGTHLPPPRVDNGIPLLSVRNIVGGVFQFRDDDSQISHKDYKSLCSSFVPKKDDVLLAIVGATLGKVALVPEMDSFHIQRSLGVFRTTKLIHPQYLSYVFESKDFQSLLWENAGFSAQPGIYLGTLSNFCVPVPPVTEQFKISEFITATVSKLDLLISQASQLITLIQERRTALISAAVTGKIDVRDWVVPDMQDAEEPQETTV
ncbi:restriction endonuclease subunit S [Serratia marcescens]|uniref:restriction endonuclease subunit S n=1 Tax=Serratia marcescens TaxID=615 RepID=UPI0013DD295F|nr:restriction endonuclease subunit S [Serratia marcescens]